MVSPALIENPNAVLAVLLGVLALLFKANDHKTGKKVFKIVPLLVFAYFVPTVLSNIGIIPLQSPLYTYVKKWLLPASLLLLTLSVDIPAIMKLGRHAIIMFLLATAGIVIGAPIAYGLLGSFVPVEFGDQAWKGLAALAGSWIGGGANFIAIGESVGAHESTISMMVVVDVAVANVWMACLLYFAGREKEMDKAIGADRKSIDELREKVEAFEKKTARPTNLADLLAITALAFIVVAVSKTLAAHLPPIGSIIRGFTWVVILVTTAGVSLSFTKVRNLEGAGASKIGSLFLYLLVATIGAKAEFARVADAPALVLVGAVWMAIHAIVLLVARRKIKSPIFFLAVGSQANVGGAASAPIVASAFHPALAPVGVLLAVGGYVLGTYAGLLTAFLLQIVHGFIR
ncbi:MAG: hypothetical protein COB53_02320 [Elusimicrobia bacterium]|nr:MAG: hypothetical protein COB53_02320 [Elusimicrobiota bacterium]